MKRQQQNITLETLLSGYDNDILLDWIKELDFFSFCKSGLIGLLADSDSFIMHIRYLDKDDLINTLRLLGLRFRILNHTAPRFIKGIEYTLEEKKRLHNDIECNSKNNIKGVKCNVSLQKEYIDISIHRLPHEKDYYILTKKEFDIAVKIENIIRESKLENKVTREFQEYKGYIDKNKLDSMTK